MSEPFVGEIRMFAGNFAPRGWAFCDGQLLAVSQNDALFSLYGTIYGGDGRTTFGLPDLRGRLPVHAGDGPGLSPRGLGSQGGQEEEVLSVDQLPAHSHSFQASGSAGNQASPEAHTAGRSSNFDFYRESQPAAGMSGEAIDAAGGGRPHDNMMPYLCVHFIVALFGIYPSRH